MEEKSRNQKRKVATSSDNRWKRPKHSFKFPSQETHKESDCLTGEEKHHEYQRSGDDVPHVTRQSRTGKEDDGQELPNVIDEKLSVDCQKDERKGEKKQPNRTQDDSDRKPRTSVNYSISLSITNQKIHEGILNVQKAFVKSVPDLQQTCIQTPKLHFVLMMMHIVGDTQLQASKRALEECKNVIAELTETPLVLHVSGISKNSMVHNKRSVLYANVVKDEQWKKLKDIIKIIRTIFQQKGIEPRTDEVIPGIAILKMAKLRQKWQNIECPAQVIQMFVAEEFGEQVVERLKLCALTKHPAEDGGYHVDGQIDLVPDAMNDQTTRNMKITGEKNETNQGNDDITQDSEKKHVEEDEAASE